VLDRRKAFGRAAGHALRWRVGRDEIRILRLEPLQLVEEPIECLVRYLRTAVDVVLLFVVPDFLAQLLDALERIGHCSRDQWSRART
jgi:hypothetical protein